MAKAINTVGADLSREYTTQEFQLGACVRSQDGGEHVFCSFAGAATAKDVVSIDEAYAAQAASNANVAGEDGQPVGVVQTTITAGSMGFVRIKGPETDVNVASNAAANAQLATTTTAGRVDDATGSGTYNIEGMVLTAAESGNTAPAFLNYPRTAVATN